jgi:hypothetical protein
MMKLVPYGSIASLQHKIAGELQVVALGYV